MSSNITKTIIDIKKCLKNDTELARGFKGLLAANLTKLMLAYESGDLNMTKESLVEINEFLEGRFLTHDGECKHLKFASDVAFKKGLLVNGTKLHFVNKHGRNVDVTHGPKLIAKFYRDQTTKVATKEITPGDKHMHKMGVQLAQLNMLMHTTGTA